MIHSFLMIGQSNMAGRGSAREVEPIINSNLKVLRNGRWQLMTTPVNYDRSTAGVSLAESFADAYSKEHSVQVGLIPCADGGTSLEQWKEGGLLYDHAVLQARLASRTSTIAGVLWHQGERDCVPEWYPTYATRLQNLIDALRRDLQLYDVPILLGGLGDFLQNRPNPIMKNYVYINEALQELAAHNEMVGYVSAKGLTSNVDSLHFNAISLREFGLRYYQEFKKLEKIDKAFPEKPKEDEVYRDVMELL